MKPCTCTRTKKKAVLISLLGGPVTLDQLLEQGNPDKIRLAVNCLINSGLISVADGKYALTQKGYSALMWRIPKVTKKAVLQRLQQLEQPATKAALIRAINQWVKHPMEIVNTLAHTGFIAIDDDDTIQLTKKGFNYIK